MSIERVRRALADPITRASVGPAMRLEAYDVINALEMGIGPDRQLVQTINERHGVLVRLRRRALADISAEEMLWHDVLEAVRTWREAQARP